MRPTRYAMLRRLAHYGPADAVEEAIFWFAYAWQAGNGSDLYAVMRESIHVPLMTRQFADDPLVTRLIKILEQNFDHPAEPPPYRPVRFKDVEEGDWLIAGTHHLCILNRFPGRVTKFLDGELVVPCNDGMHRLVPDPEGNVLGFRI